MGKKNAVEVAQELAEKHNIVLPKDDKQTEPAPVAEPSPVPKAELKPVGEDSTKDHRNPAAEKRIHELVDEIKQLRENVNSKDREYQTKLNVLEKEKEEIQRRLNQPVAQSPEEQLARVEQERIKKYLEEDKSKPKHLKREMDRSELEEWLAEDLVAASEWMADNRLRRREDRQVDAEDLHLKKKANDVIYQQELSRIRVEARHPELNVNARIDELKKQGLSKDDIQDTLCKENEKYKAFSQIFIDNPELAQKAIISPNGPELLEKEMMKRLRNPVKTETQEPANETVLSLQRQVNELQEMLAAEGIRRNNIDVNAGIRRTVGSTVPNVEVTKPKTAMDLELDKALTKLGMSREEYDKRVTERSKMPGITYNG